VAGNASSPIPLDRSLADESAVPDSATPAQPVIAPSGARPPSPLVVLSGALLIVGLGLFGIRWTARRLADS
jgi:hypothetical protein